MHWEEHSFGLPDLPKDLEWTFTLSTGADIELSKEKNSFFAAIPARTTAIFTSKKRETK